MSDPAMSDDTMQRARDAEAHRRSYEGVMRAAAEIGVPFALALTMFFTSLVMANGIWLSLFAGVLVYVFVFFVVKMFFSH